MVKMKMQSRLCFSFSLFQLPVRLTCSSVTVTCASTTHWCVMASRTVCIHGMKITAKVSLNSAFRNTTENIL